MTGWVDTSLWWHAYPLGLLDCPAQAQDLRTEHRLRRLTDWLDHVVELGLNGIALGPIFASATHGYDTVDYFEVDSRLGDRSDLDHVIAECHARGVRIMLDGVFNHVGDTHPDFLAAVEHGAGAPTEHLFRFHTPDGPAQGGRAPGQRPEYDCFEGHSQLVALNHADPAVVDLIVEVMTHWLARGVDGWRLDAAYAVPPEFWATVIGRVREQFPDCYLVGEVIHGDYVDIVTRTGMDAVTQYELWKSIWSSLNDQNFHELAWNLTRHNDFLDTFVPWTFVGNHDVTRIVSRLTRPESVSLAVVLLFLLGGTPAVYYGDELGLAGLKEERVGGDDAIRPALEPVPAEQIEGITALHRELIALRRRHPWLHRAHSHTEHLTNTVICLRMGDPDDPERWLQVGLNNDSAPTEFGTQSAELSPVPVIVAGRGAHQDGEAIRLDSFGWCVLAPQGSRDEGS
ncbi:MAG: alpha-amylase family glycosyl hydrolase [Actinomycetales bacterium]